MSRSRVRADKKIGPYSRVVSIGGGGLCRKLGRPGSAAKCQLFFSFGPDPQVGNVFVVGRNLPDAVQLGQSSLPFAALQCTLRRAVQVGQADLLADLTQLVGDISVLGVDPEDLAEQVNGFLPSLGLGGLLGALVKHFQSNHCCTRRDWQGFEGQLEASDDGVDGLYDLVWGLETILGTPGHCLLCQVDDWLG